MDQLKYLEFIAVLGDAPDSQLDCKLSKECREFKGDDSIKFLRNLQDKCAFFSGSSGFVINAIDISLRDTPESEIDKILRRNDLKIELGLSKHDILFPCEETFGVKY